MTNFIFGLLSVWRLTDLFVKDSIFMPLRELLGIRHNITHDPIGIDYGDNSIVNFLADLFSCVRCMSVWTSIFIVILSMFPYGYKYITRILSLSQLVILLEEKQ